MYRALGDREKQDEIRKASPNSVHCTELQVAPNFCSGCKLNPHKRRPLIPAKNVALIGRFSREIQTAMECIALMDSAGIRWSPDQANARDSKLMIVARNKIREIQRTETDG